MNLVNGDNRDYQGMDAADMADKLKLPKSSSRSKLVMATTGKPEILEGTTAAENDRKETSYQVRGDEEEGEEEKE